MLTTTTAVAATAAALAFWSNCIHFSQSATPPATASHRATAARSVSWIAWNCFATSNDVRPYLSLASRPHCNHDDFFDDDEDSRIVLLFWWCWRRLSLSFKASKIICTARYLPPPAALWSGVDSSPKLEKKNHLEKKIETPIWKLGKDSKKKLTWYL